MGVISWIVLGFIAGALAKWVMPGRDPGGCMITIVLGIIGAFVGGWVGTQLGWGAVDRLDMRGLALAVLGGVIVLGLYRAIRR